MPFRHATGHIRFLKSNEKCKSITSNNPKRIFQAVSTENCLSFQAHVFSINKSATALNLTISTFHMINITKTRLYNFDPIKPHFYIGLQEYTLFFLISTQKHRLWVLVKTASARRF